MLQMCVGGSVCVCVGWLPLQLLVRLSPLIILLWPAKGSLMVIRLLPLSLPRVGALTLCLLNVAVKPCCCC